MVEGMSQSLTSQMDAKKEEGQDDDDDESEDEFDLTSAPMNSDAHAKIMAKIAAQ